MDGVGQRTRVGAAAQYRAGKAVPQEWLLLALEPQLAWQQGLALGEVSVALGEVSVSTRRPYDCVGRERTRFLVCAAGGEGVCMLTSMARSSVSLLLMSPSSGCGSSLEASIALLPRARVESSISARPNPGRMPGRQAEGGRCEPRRERSWLSCQRVRSTHSFSGHQPREYRGSEEGRRGEGAGSPRTAGPYAVHSSISDSTRLLSLLQRIDSPAVVCGCDRPATYGTLLFVGGGMFGCRVRGLLRPSTPVRPRHDPRRADQCNLLTHVIANKNKSPR
eukprot:scaffold25874_cov51-Phaeocystis_antarctica.AAC.2